MPNYLAQYRQAITDGADDYARSVITSARQAAEIGLATPEEIAALVAEVKANPPH